jgi:hypothetical protein
MSAGSLNFVQTSSSGTIKYLRGPSNANLVLSGDFTIEFYIKCTTSPAAQDLKSLILSQYSAWSAISNSYWIFVDDDTAGLRPISISASGSSAVLTGTIPVNNDVWNHVAIVRSGSATNNISLFVNGSLDVRITNTTPWDFSGANGFCIASNPLDQTVRIAYQGFLSNLRIVNGTAVYTSAFIPSTTNLTAISGTALLLNTVFNPVYSLINGDFSQSDPNVVNPIDVNNRITSNNDKIPGWNVYTSFIATNNSWGYPAFLYGANAISLQQLSFIEQTINLTAGTYRVSFWLVGRPDGGGPNPINIKLNGSTINSFTPPTTVWTNYSVTFTRITTENVTIRIEGTTADQDLSTALQNVLLSSSPFFDSSPNRLIITPYNSPTPSTSAPTSLPSSLPCFKEDTKILVLKNSSEQFVPVQELRRGDLVKTLCNGFVPINLIGKKDIVHTSAGPRDKNKLYTCTQENYPELVEDLVITGCHSILVNGFVNDKQREGTIDVLGKIYVTDSKYRLPACLDERADIYEKDGTFTIYHLALDSENYYDNYGICANGLLVESCSIRYLKELTNMELI